MLPWTEAKQIARFDRPANTAATILSLPTIFMVRLLSSTRRKSMTIAAPTTEAANSEQARTAAANWLRIGDEYHQAGRNEAAIDAYRCGLAVIAAEQAGRTPVEIAAELHSKLGHAFMIGDDLESAAANYKAALRLKPDLTSC